MKTDDLIQMLAREAEPVRPANVGGRFGLALVASIPFAFALMLALLGIRPDLSASLHTAVGWAKVALTVSLLAAGWLACARLSRPGAPTGALLPLAALPLVAIAVGAVVVLLNAEPQARSAMVFGSTWRVCALNIVMLSVPVFVAAVVAMRSLAPTRLWHAGGAAGLLAGATGASVYAMHCPEDAVPFVAVWYVLGIVLSTAAGALLGPRLLRW